MKLTLNTIETPYGIFNENNRKVGGVRIKEIRDYNPSNGRTTTKQYEYKLYSTDSTKTSGVLVSSPNLISVEHIFGIDCQYLKLMPKGHYPLSSHNNSYVVYPEVRTITKGNGFVDRNYSFVPDINPRKTIYDFPFPYLKDNSHLRNLLKEEKTYNEKGKLQKKSSFNYKIFFLGGDIKWNIKFYYRIQHFWGPNYTQFNFYWSEYYTKENVVDLKYASTKGKVEGHASVLTKKIDTLFYAGGNISTGTNYFYKLLNDKKIVLKSKSESLSNGDLKNTYYSYAFDSQNDFIYGVPYISIKNKLLEYNILQRIEIKDSLLKKSNNKKILLGGKKICIIEIPLINYD